MDNKLKLDIRINGLDKTMADAEKISALINEIKALVEEMNQIEFTASVYESDRHQD